ncbi:MAG: potassium-transporting ATPase subunit F [Kofleriaceae bacterium]
MREDLAMFEVVVGLIGVVLLVYLALTMFRPEWF